MPSLSKQQLVDWLEDTGVIVRVAYISVYNLKRIHSPINAQEKKLLQSSFFQQYEMQLRHTLVIELCKLFVNSDIERRNFRKLFNRLRLDRYESSLKEQLRQNRDKKVQAGLKKDVIEMLDPLLLELDSRKDLVYRLKGLRDRTIAHIDPGHNLPEVSIEELEDLCFLAGRLYKEIALRILGNDVQLEVNADSKVDTVLSKLAV